MTNARDKANIPVLNFQSKGIDDNADATAITIDSSERIVLTTTGSTSSSPNLAIKDSGQSGTGAKARVGFLDSGNTVLGEVGYLSGGNHELSIKNIQNSDISFFTNNAEKMRLTSTGLGIGTSSPNSVTNLQIGDTYANEPMIRMETTDGGNKRLDLYVSNGHGYVTSTQSAQDLNLASRVNLIFKTDTSSERMRITSAGLVGIGESSPGTLLDIKGSAGANNRITINSSSAGNNSEVLGGIVIENQGDSVVQISGRRESAVDDGYFVIETQATGGSLSEKFRITSGGSIGIGETAPLGLLHVKTGESSSSVHASANELIVEGSANTGISILSGNSNEGAIYFGDDGNNDVGRIRYLHNTNQMDFTTNGGIRASINSSGQVGIGTTSPSTPLEIASSDQNLLYLNSSHATNARIKLQGGYHSNLFSEIVESAGSFSIDVDANNQEANSHFKVKVKGSERMRIDSNGKVLINTTTTNNGMVISNGSDTSGNNACYGLERGVFKSTIGMSSIGTMTLKNFSGEIIVIDSSGNSTTISPHNFEVIPDGASEDLAWSYYSRKGDTENNFDNTKYISADITKVIRKVENLTGDKLIYTGTGSTDDGSTVSQNIIQDLITRIESLEAEVTALKNQP